MFIIPAFLVETYSGTQGLRPLTTPYSFVTPQKSRQKRAPDLLARKRRGFPPQQRFPPGLRHSLRSTLRPISAWSAAAPAASHGEGECLWLFQRPYGAPCAVTECRDFNLAAGHPRRCWLWRLLLLPRKPRSSTTRKADHLAVTGLSTLITC